VTERNENPLEYWEARLAAHSGPESVGCLPYGRRYNAWLYRVRRRRFRALVRSLRLSTPELAVLDVGSGTGFYVEQWLRFSSGKLLSDADRPSVDWLMTKFSPTTSVVDMVVAMVQSDSFRYLQTDPTLVPGGTTP